LAGKGRGTGRTAPAARRALKDGKNGRRPALVASPPRGRDIAPRCPRRACRVEAAKRSLVQRRNPHFRLQPLVASNPAQSGRRRLRWRTPPSGVCPGPSPLPFATFAAFRGKSPRFPRHLPRPISRFTFPAPSHTVPKSDQLKNQLFFYFR